MCFDNVFSGGAETAPKRRELRAVGRRAGPSRAFPAESLRGSAWLNDGGLMAADVFSWSGSTLARQAFGQCISGTACGSTRAASVRHATSRARGQPRQAGASRSLRGRVGCSVLGVACSRGDTGEQGPYMDIKIEPLACIDCHHHHHQHHGEKYGVHACF